MSGFTRYIRWTIALLPALVASVVSLSILLTGLHQTAPAGSAKTPLPLREAVKQDPSTPAADARPAVVTTKSARQPAASVPSSLASTTDQVTLPETGVPTGGSIPVQFNPLTPTKVVSPAATLVPTRKLVYTATAFAPHELALVMRAVNPVQPANIEVRAISTGMGLPELKQLTLGETLARVIRTHERRTSSKVQLQMEHVPDQGPLPIKITLYRVVQEALSNAFRHGAGATQQVKLAYMAGELQVVVSDAGPGFDSMDEQSSEEHLGLVGMRERVESLGGIFRIESAVGCGTRISVHLALTAEEASKN